MFITYINFDKKIDKNNNNNKKYFSNIFSYSKLIKISNYFRLFENIEEIFEDLTDKLDENQYSLKKNCSTKFSNSLIIAFHT